MCDFYYKRCSYRRALLQLEEQDETDTNKDKQRQTKTKNNELEEQNVAYNANIRSAAKQPQKYLKSTYLIPIHAPPPSLTFLNSFDD